MLATLSVVGIIGNTLTIYVFNSQKQKVGELPKSCPNHAQIMPKSCPNHAQIMPKICPNHAQIMPESCPNHAQIMPKSSPNYTQIMPKYISVTKNGQLTIWYVITITILNLKISEYLYSVKSQKLLNQGMQKYDKHRLITDCIIFFLSEAIADEMDIL